MKKYPSFNQMKAMGFTFPGARAWVDRERLGQLAQDAALITVPNTTVPAEFLAYIDPRVVEILTAPRQARELFAEVKKGDWTTAYAKWRMKEVAGRTQPYNDFVNNGVADVNNAWASRNQYLFQTVIEYGDYEAAVSGVARIELAAEKQVSAATVIDIDANKFYLLGVRGREIYGLLNDPNLPPAIAANPSGTGGSLKWADKNTQAIYQDILALFAELVAQSSGLISNSTPLTLALSPSASVHLGTATDFNISVLDMLNKYFSSLKIVTLPELGNLPAGDTVFLVAPEVNGMATAELAFGEKIRAGRLVGELSALRQKYTSGTYGGLVFIPFAFAQMTGI
jgi:hypothetical protein